MSDARPADPNTSGDPGADPSDPWEDALLVASLLAVDPRGLGGVRIQAHAGPVRDEWLACLNDLLPSSDRVRRLPVHAAEDRLLGGLDLAATLGSGRAVAEQGLLAVSNNGVIVAPMAERLPPATTAVLCSALDTGEVALERDGLSARYAARFCLIALDEGIGEEEALAAPIGDRLAFSLDLTGLSHRDTLAGMVEHETTAEARQRLDGIAVEDSWIEALCAAALALGVGSLRAPLFALRVARTHCALEGREAVDERDAAVAGRLVLAPRATRLPAQVPPEDSTDPPPEPDTSDQSESNDTETDRALEDRVLDAAAAAIPAGLLAALAGGQRVRGGTASGRQGQTNRSRTRGRPAGVVRGDPRRGDRLNVIETLRAAAPWQRLRRAANGKVAVRADDFRATRFKQPVETVTIFVVDASGSAALHRLAEAKGAVELLLADCYVRRDHVALIAFRGETADLLLPPTRSLVRAKRSLAGLPGGGGTPLAAGLEMAAALAESVRRRGQTPGVVVLTDGRANVARDGTPGRAAAETDAQRAAEVIARLDIPVVLIDTAPRPHPMAATLAQSMAARYLPLPHADSATLSQAVRASGLAGPSPRRAAS